VAAAIVLAWWLGTVDAVQPDAWPVRLTDVAARAGLDRPSIYGESDRKRFIIETNGCGTGLLDFDRDGWLDALVLSGTRLEPKGRREVSWAPGSAPLSRLYRNRGNGTFEDVTARVGLDKVGWASSVCAADYDGDGWIDLFLTYFGQNVLYRNDAGRRFEDATARAGLARPDVRWGSGCSFIDHDRDGSSSPITCDSISAPLRSPARGGTACGEASR
jgi:hypothetical protein